MNLKEYLKLSEQEKIKRCQNLSMYNSDELLIFQSVEKLFIKKYGNHEGIEKVECGMAPMLGPYNCLKIFIPRGKKRVVFPKYFEGFPIYKIYESHYKTYRILMR